MPPGVGGALDLHPSRSVKQCHIPILAEGFIREVSGGSVPSRAVLAAPSLARRFQLCPCLLERSEVGVWDLGQAPPLRFEFRERRLESHDLTQIAQDRNTNRRGLCVAR